MHAPQAQQQLKSQPRRKWGGWIVAGFAAAGVVASVITAQLGTVGDRPLSAEQVQARLVAFEQAAPLPLAPVTPDERAAAIATIDLATLPAGARQAIEDGSEPLAWLTLWDNWDEDGDTVEITSHGFSRTVRLTNAGTRIAVPVPEGGVINVRGVYDGGGGITVAIRTPQGQVALPIMAVGQVVGVPVQAGP